VTLVQGQEIVFIIPMQYHSVIQEVPRIKSRYTDTSGGVAPRNLPRKAKKATELDRIRPLSGKGTTE
jgi:hypothetical protein